MMRASRRTIILLATAASVVYATAALLGVAPGLGWYWDREFTRSLVGVGASLGEPVAAFDTPRAFNGDGYSIARYRLPEVVAERFRTPAAIAGYPLATDDRREWQRTGWRPAAGWASDSAYIDFALDAAPDSLRAAARQALGRPGTWYALQYKVMTPGRIAGDTPLIMNVDLFIVDPHAGALILANHNT